MLAFIGFALGQIVGMISEIGVFPGSIGPYVEILGIGFALTIFAIVAIFAAGYRSAGLIPLIVYMPTAIFLGQGYLEGLGVAEAFNQYFLMIIPLFIVFLLPIFLFMNTYRIMRKSGTPGRTRPLGMSIAIMIYIAIRIPILVFPGISQMFGFDLGYAMITSAFIIFWLSITGRLERR